jgi:hypothetical protein
MPAPVIVTVGVVDTAVGGGAGAAAGDHRQAHHENKKARHGHDENARRRLRDE